MCFTAPKSFHIGLSLHQNKKSSCTRRAGLVDGLPNGHTKPYDLVHDFYPSQDLTHLGVVAPQTQFRTDELLEAIHGGLSYRALMIARVLFLLLQLSCLERGNRLVAWMAFLPECRNLSRRYGGSGYIRILLRGQPAFASPVR